MLNGLSILNPQSIRTLPYYSNTASGDIVELIELAFIEIIIPPFVFKKNFALSPTILA